MQLVAKKYVKMFCILLVPKKCFLYFPHQLDNYTLLLKQSEVIWLRLNISEISEKVSRRTGVQIPKIPPSPPGKPYFRAFQSKLGQQGGLVAKGGGGSGENYH